MNSIPEKLPTLIPNGTRVTGKTEREGRRPANGAVPATLPDAGGDLFVTELPVEALRRQDDAARMRLGLVPPEAAPQPEEELKSSPLPAESLTERFSRVGAGYRQVGQEARATGVRIALGKRTNQPISREDTIAFRGNVTTVRDLDATLIELEGAVAQIKSDGSAPAAELAALQGQIVEVREARQAAVEVLQETMHANAELVADAEIAGAWEEIQNNTTALNQAFSAPEAETASTAKEMGGAYGGGVTTPITLGSTDPSSQVSELMNLLLQKRAELKEMIQQFFAKLRAELKLMEKLKFKKMLRVKMQQLLDTQKKLEAKWADLVVQTNQLALHPEKYSKEELAGISRELDRVKSMVLKGFASVEKRLKRLLALADSINVTLPTQ